MDAADIAAIRAAAADDPSFTFIAVDPRVAGVNLATLTYEPAYEELEILSVEAVLVNGTEQPIGAEANDWSFDSARQELCRLPPQRPSGARTRSWSTSAPGGS